MPARPAKTDPDAVDQLAADVESETLEYPAGTPELLPVLKLPRMRRADAYELLGNIQDQQRRVKRLDPAEDDELDTAEGEVADTAEPVKVAQIDPLSYGTQYRVVAYIEQFLGVVAVDPRAYATWAAAVADAELVKVFNTYNRKTQPGEAESSTG